MNPSTKLVAAGLGASLLCACVPPDAPPPNFRPNPPYAPEPVGEPTQRGLFRDYRNNQEYQDESHSQADPYRRSSYSPRRDPYAERGYDDDRYIDPASPEPQRTQPSNRTASRKDYPVARKSNKLHEVISPYEPYNRIDVEGFSSGQLAKDPSNGKIFRVP